MTCNPAAPFLRLHVFAAGHGDCSVIEYGAGDESNLLVIDGGVASTQKHLVAFLRDRPASRLELLVVTHIDSDHIAGAIALLKEEDIASRFEDIWFNGSSPPTKSRKLEEFGFKQGDTLSERLRTLPHNNALEGRDICTDEDAVTRRKMTGGASLTLLSPSANVLQRLRENWTASTNALKRGKDDERDKQQRTTSRLEVLGSEKMDLEELAASHFTEDTSVSNASSIAFVFEFQGRRIAMTGDSWPSHLVKAVGRLENGTPQPVDIFKVPHHGSAKNSTFELFKAFPASTYVISTDAKHHGHPSDSTLARIALTSPGCSLVFNYHHACASKWSRHSQRHGGFKTLVPRAQDRVVTLDLLTTT